jgi:hypothetical protein
LDWGESVQNDNDNEEKELGTEQGGRERGCANTEEEKRAGEREREVEEGGRRRGTHTRREKKKREADRKNNKRNGRIERGDGKEPKTTTQEKRR